MTCCWSRWIIALHFILGASVASAESTLDGIVELGYATATNGAEDYGFLRVEPTWRWSRGKFTSHIEARYEFDILDSLEPGKPGNNNRATYSQRLHAGKKHALDLREMFIDYQTADISLRLGKQQIVWGEADGLRLLDVLNPQSFADLAFNDFDQSRIPLWAANLTWYLGRTSIQLVWQPDSSTHEWVDEGGVYALPLPDEVRHAEAPSGSDFALRTGYDGNGWNISAYAARRHQDQAISDGPFTAAFPRETILGLSGSLVAKDIVLRIEARHSDNRQWVDERTLEPVLDEATSALLGIDWTLGPQTWLSLQIVATKAPHNRLEALLEDAATLTMNRTWNHNKGNIELQSVFDTRYQAGFGRLSVSYELTSRVQLVFRYTDIYSDDASVFSGLKDTDHLLLGVRMSL